MKITEHLQMIDELITNRSAPSKIRGHIQAIREQLEAYEQEVQKVAEYKERIAELEAENAKLKTPATPRYGSQPRIKGRMEGSNPCGLTPRNCELGSGKMKAALQCIEWNKKGRSCFHELRWSRHSQEVQCALRSG